MAWVRMSSRLAALAVTIAVLAGSAHAQPADLVLLNGRIATLDAKSTIASALAVRADTIIAVGDNDAI